MESRVFVVVMVDGLRAHALGAYGNTAYSTPSFDRLAAGGVLFDRYLAESNRLVDAYDALWSGRHSLEPAPSKPRPLIEELTNLGYQCHLVTDDSDVGSRRDAERFEEITLVEAHPGDVAPEVFDTSMGRVLEAAADVLGQWAAEYEQPRLLWVHLRGLLAPWDAPPELADSLIDDQDPQLTPTIEVPEQQIARGEQGEDESFLAACRYAAQVMALDRCMGALDELLDELLPEMPPTVLVAGTRGFALGEHGRLGIAGDAHRELFHVPLMVRGENLPAMVREQGLVQTSDMYDLVVSLARGELPVAKARTVAAGSADGSHYLVTEQWQYVTRPGGDARPGLYVEPDDLWQANDLADRLPTDVQQFEELMQEVQICIESRAAWHELALPTEQPAD